MAQAAESLVRSSCLLGNDTRSLYLMASALGLRDRYTHGHAHRVAVYAKRLSMRLGLAMHEVLQVAMGGMLHDVGKLGLSDKLFTNRSSSLSEDLKWEVFNHPLIGAALLEKIKCPQTITDAVLYHHERIDGSGYPFGNGGDEIPLSAKIVSIADCFDAITTDRPYQRRKSCQSAFSCLEESSGSRLDASLVAMFIDEIQYNGMAHHQTLPQF